MDNINLKKWVSSIKREETTKLRSKDRKWFFKDLFSSAFMLQASLVWSFFNFISLTSNDHFLQRRTSSIQGEKQCEWFSKEKFFEQSSFKTIYYHRGWKPFPLPTWTSTAAVNPKHHCQEWCGSLSPKQMPRLGRPRALHSVPVYPSP